MESADRDAFDGGKLHIISAIMNLLGGHVGGPLSGRSCHEEAE
jgi:hypothetical protein